MHYNISYVHWGISHQNMLPQSNNLSWTLNNVGIYSLGKLYRDWEGGIKKIERLQNPSLAKAVASFIVCLFFRSYKRPSLPEVVPFHITFTYSLKFLNFEIINISKRLWTSPQYPARYLHSPECYWRCSEVAPNQSRLYIPWEHRNSRPAWNWHRIGSESSQ